MDGVTNVMEISKCLASRDFTTCLNLEKVQIKGIQDLVWWIHDGQTNNQPLIVAEFGQFSKRAVMTRKLIDKERAETDTNARGLGKFKAEDFETTEDGFHKLFYQKTGTTKVEIKYVIQNKVVPEVLPDVVTEWMYQIWIYGETFGENNRTVFRMLKSI